jgi:hypothetical protein
MGLVRMGGYWGGGGGGSEGGEGSEGSCHEDELIGVIEVDHDGKADVPVCSFW